MSATTNGGTTTFLPVQGPVAPTANAVVNLTQAEPRLTRTYYQDGRLLTAVDLNRDYTYLDRRLLDLGLTLGDGIVQGLVATMTDGHTISVTQGRGIAPSGRVISYTAADPTVPLTADLTNDALLATLNGAGFAGLADGLYAVVLLHGQQPSGVAEVFPRDLSSTRITYEMIQDTVEIALIGLSQPIPGGNPYQARAAVALQFASGQNLPSLPLDSVSLGVVAIQKSFPVWFDPSLLTHPLRATDDPTATADDLARQYGQLYGDMMTALRAQGTTTISAASVWQTLPVRGLLPAATINQPAATQTFFPDQISVALVPARTDEVNDLLAQTEGEPPIDLTSGAAAQVLVMVPLTPADFAVLAPQLLGAVTNAPPPAFLPYPTLSLPRIDPLVLRLPGRLPPPPSQPTIWARIWALAPTDLPWMVMPTDGGIGGVSAAQLAAGYNVPPPPPPTTPAPTTTAPVTTTAAPTTTTPPTTAPTTTAAPTTTPPPTTTQHPTTSAAPATTSQPPTTTQPPTTSAPPTTNLPPTTAPPATTHPPFTVVPPVTVHPPITLVPPVIHPT